MPASRHDLLGNAVSLADPDSLGPLNDFVEGFIACEARVVNILQVAAPTPTSPLVQACCAALHMFAESGDAPGNARPFIEAARRSTMRITPREQRFVEAVAAWVEGDLPRAIALHEEQAREHPRDLASLKLGQYHLFNLGNSPGMLRIVQPALHAAAEVPTCTAWRPSPGSNATCWSRPKRRRAARWPSSPRSPGPSTRWRT
jgi:hypothetical protein